MLLRHDEARLRSGDSVAHRYGGAVIFGMFENNEIEVFCTLGREEK